MNKLVLVGVAAITIAGSLSNAHAADDDGARIGSFGAGVGLNGLSLDYAYHLNAYFDLRAGYNFGSLTFNGEEEDGVKYDVKLKFASGRLLVDYKPFAGGFHLTAGITSGGPKLDLAATGVGEGIKFDDHKYNLDGDANGRIDFKGTAPYIGLGWGGTTNGTGFGVSTDFGVILTGAAKTRLKVPSGFACDAEVNDGCTPREDGFDINGESADAAQFRASVNAEEADLKDNVGKLKFYPVTRLSIVYRF